MSFPIDPWRYVDADDALVEDFLAGTVEAVLELGGWVHPEARFEARDGQLSVRCDVPDGEPLMRIPAAAFVRIGKATWTGSDELLEVDGLVAELEPEELGLLVLQTSLHNAMGKIPWICQAHPVLAPDLSSEVIGAVRAFRPRFRVRQPTPASLFWSNRVLRLPTQHSHEPEPVALPLLDLLNHDARGAVGQWTGTEFTVAVAHAASGDECFLDYGLQRDAMGMAVVYGFADASNPYAHSAPLTVEVEGAGEVTVEARGRSRSGSLLPLRVTAADGAASVNRVSFGPGGVEQAARELHEAGPWTAATAQSIAASIADANRALLANLASACPPAASGVGASTASEALARAAAHQRDIIA